MKTSLIRDEISGACASALFGLNMSIAELVVLAAGEPPESVATAILGIGDGLNDNLMEFNPYVIELSQSASVNEKAGIILIWFCHIWKTVGGDCFHCTQEAKITLSNWMKERSTGPAFRIIAAGADLVNKTAEQAKAAVSTCNFNS